MTLALMGRNRACAARSHCKVIRLFRPRVASSISPASEPVPALLRALLSAGRGSVSGLAPLICHLKPNARYGYEATHIQKIITTASLTHQEGPAPSNSERAASLAF